MRPLIVAVLLLVAAAVACPAQKKRAKKVSLEGGKSFTLPIEVEGADGMDFHLHLPSGWKRKTKKKFPVLLALHGNGQASRGIFNTHRKLSSKKSPLIIMAPKYQKEQRFGAECWPRGVCMKAFDWLMEQARTRFHGDPDRLFVEGFSMGGSYASMYASHCTTSRKDGEPFPIRGAILNSGIAYGPRTVWPEGVPTLCVVGEKETAVLGKHNLVKSVSAAANGLFRKKADVRYHLMPGMGHTVSAACLELTRALVFDECGPVRSVEKEIAAFKKRLKKEKRRMSRLRCIERLAARLEAGSRRDRVNKSVAKLSDLEVMVSEREAWKQLGLAIDADKPGDAGRRKAYEALVKSHRKTEAGRIAKSRLEWID